MSRALAWAFHGALRCAIGACVVALLLATMLSGDAAERFATTAYLAAAFAAACMAIQCFLPAAAVGRERKPAPVPPFVGYSMGVVVFLSIVAALVSQPVGEAFAFILFITSVLAVAFVHSGTIPTLRAALVRRGILIAASRYCAICGVCALGLAALLPRARSESAAEFAYLFMVLTALFVWCGCSLQRDPN